MSEDRRTEVYADDDESFLDRWSRRKTMARQGEPLPEPTEETADTEDADGAGADAADPPGADVAAAEHEAAELPPLESLDEDSDYSAFMASNVTPDVRRQALRKLFHSSKFNVRDGLDDYDLDYSNPEPLGDIVTAEMRRRMMLALERLAEEEADVSKPTEPVALADDAGEAAEDNEEQQGPEQDADDERPATS